MDTAFACSDMGMLIDSALVFGDPVHFPAAPYAFVAEPSQSSQWLLWWYDANLKVELARDFSSEAEARNALASSGGLSLLIGPDTMEPNKARLGKYEEELMCKLKQRAEQHRKLHRAAVGVDTVDATPKSAKSPTADAPSPSRRRRLSMRFRRRSSKRDEESPTFNDESEEDIIAVQTPLSARQLWEAELVKIREQWVKEDCKASGLAPSFRGPKKLRWNIKGESTEAYMADLILDQIRSFADLVRTHTQVMGAVRNMSGAGGAKEALATIHALRARSSINGQLATSMDAFIAAAQVLNGLFRHELFEHVKEKSRVPDQLPAMQRVYQSSFTDCLKLRDAILTEWHRLSVKVNDASLARAFNKIAGLEKESYQKLLQLPVILPALCDGPHFVSDDSKEREVNSSKALTCPEGDTSLTLLAPGGKMDCEQEQDTCFVEEVL